MTDKQREKDNQKHQESLDNLIKLPPKWKVKNNSQSEYLFLNENNIVELISKKDNNTMRKFCWAVYNKIEK